MAPKDILTREFLTEHFIESRKSHRQICEEFNIKSVNSVSQACIKHGVTRSSLHNSSEVLTKEFLEEYYVRQNMSLRDVAEKAGFKSKSVVSKALERHDLSKREHTKSQKIIDAVNKRRSHHTIPGRFYHSIISGADRRGFEVSINIDDLWTIFEEQGGKCSLTGLELIFPSSGERATTQTASIDRINSDAGYIKGNIQWVHKDINKMKMDLSQDRFIELCELVSNRKF